MQIDITDVDVNEVTSGSMFVSEACKGHLLVETVNEETGEYEATDDKPAAKKPVEVKCEVVAADKDSQLTKRTTIRLPHSGGGLGKTFAFAIATGCITQGDLDEAQRVKDAGGEPNLSIDLSLAEGRSFCAEIEPNTYKEKTTFQVGFKMFHLDDEKCKDFPKNAEHVALHESTKGKTGEPKQNLSEGL